MTINCASVHRRWDWIVPRCAQPGKDPLPGPIHVQIQRDQIDEAFTLPWGKTTRVQNLGEQTQITLGDAAAGQWAIEVRAYDEGVAFRYRIDASDGAKPIEVRDDTTQFQLVGQPRVMFNTLDGFTTSHESLYEYRSLAELPVNRLIDCPLLAVWPDRSAVAITEASVRHFSGMYLRRRRADATAPCAADLRRESIGLAWR